MKHLPEPDSLGLPQFFGNKKTDPLPPILLPETGYLRLSQILGNKNAKPPIPPMIPVGKTTWWDGVKSGRFPRPVKLSSRITAWRIEDIRALINQWPSLE